jgi:NADPH:quinone reductase-like Zn-dependent oxidoreductase
VIADTVFPLEDAAEARWLGEKGRTIGKIVLSITS